MKGAGCRDLKGLVYWFMAILWIGMIFWFSHQPATDSARLSSGLLNGLIWMLGDLAKDFSSSLLHTLIRKAAHFLNYAMLGVWVALAVRNTSFGTKNTNENLPDSRTLSRMLFELRHRRLLSEVATVLIICILAAIFDEIHQLFIPGRSGEVRDVLIDSAGASLGAAAVWWIATRRARRKTQLTARG